MDNVRASEMRYLAANATPPVDIDVEEWIASPMSPADMIAWLEAGVWSVGKVRDLAWVGLTPSDLVKRQGTDDFTIGFRYSIGDLSLDKVRALLDGVEAS